MRARKLFAAQLLAALVMLALFASSSLALTGGGSGSSRAVPGSKAFHLRAHYVEEYTDGIFGPIKCEGTHIASKKYPGTATSGGADKFKCASTTGLPIPAVTPKGPVGFGSWASDYFYYVVGLPEYVLATEVSGKGAKDAKSFKALAIY